MSTITALTEAGAPAHQELLREVQDLFLEKLSVRIASTDQDLFQSGILDSTAVVQLLLLIEQHFGLSLAIDQVGADSFRSVDNIARLIADRRPAASRPHILVSPAAAENADTVAVIRGLFLDKMAIRIDSDEADLFETGIFDSMTLVEFILHLEERFELRFPMEELELDTVLSVVKLAELVSHAKHSAAGAS